MVQGVDDGNNLRLLRQPLLFLFRHERPQFVHVDDRPPLYVAGQVVVSHTNLTEVTRMVLVKVGAEIDQIKLHSKDLTAEIKRTGGGADHQRDRDLRGACGAFQHDRDRQRHGHGVCESSRGGSAYSAKQSNINNLVLMHPSQIPSIQQKISPQYIHSTAPLTQNLLLDTWGQRDERKLTLRCEC